MVADACLSPWNIAAEDTKEGNTPTILRVDEIVEVATADAYKLASDADSDKNLAVAIPDTERIASLLAELINVPDADAADDSSAARLIEDANEDDPVALAYTEELIFSSSLNNAKDVEAEL